MRRIVVAVMGTISALVLLFSYHTSRNEGTTLAGGDLGSLNGSDGTSQDQVPLGQGGSGTSNEPGASQDTTGGKNYLGDAVDTQWGPVQVQITVSGGEIVAAEVTQVPMNNGHDVRINTEAVPILNDSAVQAQSADFDSISGATVTSEGYKASLQSAIDRANL